MIRLYELTDSYARILALAEEAEDGEWLEALAGLQGAIEEKAETIVKAVRILEAEAEAFTAEAQRMAAQAATRGRRVDSLKEYLKSNLEAAGLSFLKAGLFTVALQANSMPTCIVSDEAAIPADFWYTPPPPPPPVDKKAITKHWKETGEQVPGAEVVQGRHLRIR